MYKLMNGLMNLLNMNDSLNKYIYKMKEWMNDKWCMHEEMNGELMNEWIMPELINEWIHN